MPARRGRAGGQERGDARNLLERLLHEVLAAVREAELDEPGHRLGGLALADSHQRDLLGPAPGAGGGTRDPLAHPREPRGEVVRHASG